jgi:hypothetical protein
LTWLFPTEAILIVDESKYIQDNSRHINDNPAISPSKDQAGEHV